MFCNIEGEEDIAVAGVEALLEHRVAGVVFLAFVVRDLAARGRAPAGRACRSCSSGSASSGATRSGPQDTEGGRLATEHLLELGHERIAYVRTPLVERSGDRARYAGYRAAMRKAGWTPTAPLQWEPGRRHGSRPAERALELADDVRRRRRRRPRCSSPTTSARSR